MLFEHAPRRVCLNEVSVRDGFQSEAVFVPTEDKIRLIDALSATGLARIEVTSFVSPKAIPNLRDAAEVMQAITRVPGVIYTALVPNEKGAERALACAADEINLVMSIGERHNLANMRMRCDQSLAQFRNIMKLVAAAPVRVNGTIATAFGCPFDGEQPLDRVLWAAGEYLAMGMHSLTLADTTGMGHPQQVADFCRAVRTAFPGVPVTAHFHNTRGMGLANVLAAVDAGVDSIDASLGGIGGCPYAPGATGNICTEDTVHMLEACGIDTGVDLDALLDLARELPTLLGHPVPGQVLQAGKRTQRQACPEAA
ncbi:hydroxymethylglutaryl-CoA lyase [Parazoarcus communis]|uniref:Hydroxymethylglutaryl-CoA lyase n=1 Tax=Parazoarcus communis TaxID=41977 RepID=A0A2U8H064_9RHOO|nr:hydroxymethylglutaryl-CoA lyase [Parazoarcus communis]AWI79281.1 hydroxymethylglutaryl-CoA lyase [Parazoarcus communis]